MWRSPRACRAAVFDAGLLLGMWGLAPIHVDLFVRISHGSRDARVRAATAHGLVDLLPHASVTVLPRHGHFSWATSDAVIEAADELTR